VTDAILFWRMNVKHRISIIKLEFKAFCKERKMKMLLLNLIPTIQSLNSATYLLNSETIIPRV
ncbi:MAG TPA: hypothetical protein VKK79_07535, partial [Candidatus Lokiarchaeia archaeon]|nr:hypothetical protein [Candidatus Lokiarchaeia archaeon]